MKNGTPIALLTLLFCTLLIRVVFASASVENSLQHSGAAFSIEYLEDASGNMTLEQVQAKAISGSFQPHSGYSLNFGESRSAWWLRIKLEDIEANNQAEYLSIYNPTVEKAVLYLPVTGKDGMKYREFRSGWYFNRNTQEECYLYPVFRLVGNIDHGSHVYLMLQSPFTQNYEISFLSGSQFNEIKLKTLLSLGLFLGVLLAMAIYNLIIFIGLRDKAYIYYVVYILSMVVYQLALLGVSRVFLPRLGELLVANVIAFGMVMVAATIVFFRSFFDTKKNFPGYDRLFKFFLLLAALGVWLMLMDRRFEANIYSPIYAMAVMISILWVAVLALKRGFQQAKFFLAGWSIIFLSLVISVFRYIGYLPNNGLTLNIVLVSSAMESILLSAALVDRVKHLNMEKEKALTLYKNAEESSKSNEMAFLQAQIKPHFLYNTLNIIAALCRIDAQKARELILDLSGYLRHTFDFKNLAKYITFAEELEYIQNYARIEQARFKDKLKVEFELDDTEGLRIPPLILQPLVENAIRHGIRKSGSGGSVILRVRSLVDCFIIEVEDDGAGMTEEQIQEVMTGNPAAVSGVGLTNIRKRMQTLYGTQFSIQSKLGAGTKITLVFLKERKNA